MLKIHLKLKFGFTELRYNLKANPKKARKTLGMGFLILFVICYVLGFYGFVAYSMIDAAKAVHMEGLILAATILAAQLVVLIFGIFYMMGLYHSRDMELLASLPVTPGKVFTVKLIMALLSEIGTFALITAPVFVIYGVITGAALGFYLKSIVVILFGALLPMVVSGLIAALLVRLSVFSRRKELIAAIGGFLLFALVMIGNMFFSMSLQKGLLEGGLGAAIQGQSALLHAITASFPPATWAAQGLTQTGLQSLGSLGLLVIASLAGVALLAAIAGSMYFTGALAQLESAKRLKAKDISTAFGSVKSPVSAVFSKEWKTVLRSSNYALNSLIGIITGPLILVVLSFGSGGSNQGGQEISKLLQGGGSLTGSLVLCGLMMFVAGMNTAAATSVTREGRAFWLAKTVPASADLQVKGKFYFGSSIALLGVASTGIAGGIILGLPLLSVLAAVIVALLMGGAVSAIGVTMDMQRPKLYWESERQAIKQTMNAFLITMVGFAIVIVFAIAAVLLGSSGLSDILIWLILIAVALFVFIAFERRMSAKAERAYDNIEF